ncbi:MULTISPECIES: LysR substrate-binding domain-containing protein [Cupriavidus]|uniref:LysR substrate-binding domain-containing protein n=1 Tax=Cupriavidus TaxID=106589 RepID=UPI000E1A4C4C|nr:MULTISPECIES: LysR substrate-binding domain-containing protein [Cupriavidus]MEC3767827.1 LysR substrate-binding domain-containing protein [Cupriavidus sp. SS-3]SOY94927.1 putative HTH-type transcriptional regulator GbpR [Cupriavidus taiwanensis]SOY98763.1 putative HTH-type transcriptional regulator GbpR [Cupriavidus taiwanensis]
MDAIGFLRSGLKLRHLRLVIALEEHRQVARVANAMNITQPAVSKALAEVEEGLGYPLFVRRPRGIEPTPHGMIFVSYAQSILDELDRAGDELLALGQGACASIAVGAMPGSTLALAPRIIALAKARMPTLNIAVYEAPMDVLIGQLRTGRLDIVLGALSERATAGDIEQRHLYEEVLRVAVHPEHPLAASATVDWPDLAPYPWVVPPRTARLRQSLDASLRRMKVEVPANHVESVSAGLVLGLLEAMQAVAMMTGRLARAYAALGLAHVLPLEIPGVLLPVSTFTLAGKAPSPAVELFQQCAEQASAG